LPELLQLPEVKARAVCRLKALQERWLLGTWTLIVVLEPGNCLAEAEGMHAILHASGRYSQQAS